MRRNKKIRKFGRVRKVRRALLKSLVTALVEKGKINTTETKARELRPVVEKMITLAKKGTVASRRLIGAKLSSATAHKLFSEITPKYKARSGGYARIIKTNIRKSDGAKMAIIELV